MLALYRSGRQAEALEAYKRPGERWSTNSASSPERTCSDWRSRSSLTTTRSMHRRAPKPCRAPHVDSRGRPPRARLVERKRVTVIFAALATANEAEQDPEQSAAFLDRVHDEATAEIESFGGSRRDRPRRRAAGDVRRACAATRGSRRPGGRRGSRRARSADACVRRSALASHGRRERRGDPRQVPARS